MTTLTWTILAVASAIGGLWTLFVALEFKRLRDMHREVAERLRQEQKTRK